MAEALRGNALFRQLSDRDLTLVAELARAVHFEPDRAITSQGDDGAGRFYLITQGEARVEVGGRLEEKLHAGDAFGEIALLDGGPRSATVIAETPVDALFIASWNLRPLLRGHLSIAEALLVEMCRRLRLARSNPLA